jgi:hypothetical protein
MTECLTEVMRTGEQLQLAGAVLDRCGALREVHVATLRGRLTGCQPGVT